MTDSFAVVVLFLSFISIMCMFAYIDTCIYPGAHRDQKRVLELEIVVNHLVGSGNQTGSLKESVLLTTKVSPQPPFGVCSILYIFTFYLQLYEFV